MSKYSKRVLLYLNSRRIGKQKVLKEIKEKGLPIDEFNNLHYESMLNANKVYGSLK